MTKSNGHRTTAPTQVMGDNIPSILVIGGSKELVMRCWSLGGTLGAIVTECTLADAANVAARGRPLAIVLPEDLYQFDPNELDALARDVRASVVVLKDESLSDEELTGRLLAAISEASRRRLG